jgi:hypothetical protein
MSIVQIFLAKIFRLVFQHKITSMELVDEKGGVKRDMLS